MSGADAVIKRNKRLSSVVTQAEAERRATLAEASRAGGGCLREVSVAASAASSSTSLRDANRGTGGGTTPGRPQAAAAEREVRISEGRESEARTSEACTSAAAASSRVSPTRVSLEIDTGNVSAASDAEGAYTPADEARADIAPPRRVLTLSEATRASLFDLTRRPVIPTIAAAPSAAPPPVQTEENDDGAPRSPDP